MSKNIVKRLFCYFAGLFVLTIGIAFSVKSDLGVSPVSSIPYSMTCIWGIEMGKATILFHVILVLIQIILLRRNFKIHNLLQIIVGIIFGYFTTFSNWCLSFIPSVDNLWIRILFMLISTILSAIGIFLYLPPDIMPLAGEGAMMACSTVSGIAFSKIKIMFDCTMVLISLVLCLIFIHSLGSVGLGTGAAALLVGSLLGLITKFFGQSLNNWLK